jgi:hypothetical protein
MRVLRAAAEPAVSSALRSSAIRIAHGAWIRARKLSKVSSVQAGSIPSSHCRTSGSRRKSGRTMVHLKRRSHDADGAFDRAATTFPTSPALGKAARRQAEQSPLDIGRRLCFLDPAR